MGNNKFLQAAAFTLIGLVAGYFLSTVFQASPNCPAPNNLRLTGKTAHTLDFSWDPMSGANYYAIEVRDSARLDTIFRLLITQQASLRLDSLESGKGYEVRVFTVCDVSQNQASISPAATIIGGSTEFIIVEEVPPGIKSQCTFDICDSVIAVDGAGCFNLSTDDASYQVEIQDAAGNVVARNLFSKWMEGALLRITPHPENPCSDNGPKPENPAGDCTPISGNRICGSFTPPGSAAVTYTISFTAGPPARCCVSVSSPGYTVSVSMCRNGDIVK